MRGMAVTTRPAVLAKRSVRACGARASASVYTVQRNDNLWNIANKYGVEFDTSFAEDLRRLEPLVESGLAEVTDEVVSATPRGELFIRNLAMCFDTYWREKHEGGDRPTFSRTV